MRKFWNAKRCTEIIIVVSIQTISKKNLYTEVVEGTALLPVELKIFDMYSYCVNAVLDSILFLLKQILGTRFSNKMFQYTFHELTNIVEKLKHVHICITIIIIISYQIKLFYDDIIALNSFEFVFFYLHDIASQALLRSPMLIRERKLHNYLTVSTYMIVNANTLHMYSF